MKKDKKRGVLLILFTILLLFIGLSLLVSASKGIRVSLQDIVTKQTLWAILGIILLFSFSRIDYRLLGKIAYPLYILSLFLLILVLIFGSGRAGTQRWLKIGPFFFQPSEFAKIAFVFSLSYCLSKKEEVGIGRFFFSLILFFLPFILIIHQPNLGSAALLIPVFLGLLYLAGAKKKYIISLVLIALSLLPFFWSFLHGYQKERLLVFINPNADPLGAGYNILQSKIAIGSGGLLGKGFLNGTQTQLAFLPEYHTDFIFCILAEEWGFGGAILLFLLFFLFLREIFKIASYTRDRFGTYVASGFGIMFATQIFLNIGMTLGILPIVGLPLPFLSYGGSSLVASLVAVGILFNIKENEAMF